jgi:hypothetical protein
LLLPADAEHDDEQGTIVVRQQRQQIQEVSPTCFVCHCIARRCINRRRCWSFGSFQQHMQLTSCCCLLLQLQAALGQRDKHITSLQEALAAKSDEVSSNI